MYDDGISLEPKLVYLSTSEGSSAGGVLYATIIAAGVDDDYTLLNGSDDICNSTINLEKTLNPFYLPDTFFFFFCSDFLNNILSYIS